MDKRREQLGWNFFFFFFFSAITHNADDDDDDDDDMLSWMDSQNVECMIITTRGPGFIDIKFVPEYLGINLDAPPFLN